MHKRTTRKLAEYVLPEEVAHLCRCSIHTVRHWIATGKLPSTRPGRRRLVRRADLLRFLARNPKQVAGDGIADDGNKNPSPSAAAEEATRDERQLAIPGTER